MSLRASKQWPVASGQKWLVVAMCVFLSACGFQPMYSKNPVGQSTALAGVYIEKVSGEESCSKESPRHKSCAEKACCTVGINRHNFSLSS